VERNSGRREVRRQDVREERRTRDNLYYIEGSTVHYAEPQRRKVEEPVKKKRPRNYTHPKAAAKAESSLYFDRGYAVVLIIAALIMIASLGVMVKLQNTVDDRKREIGYKESSLSSLKTDNDAFEESLAEKYSLDHIYDVATKQLGMVYSRAGQILHYDKANEDYVKQMHDVPEAN